jgi:glutathionylspermidine synthase
VYAQVGPYLGEVVFLEAPGEEVFWGNMQKINFQITPKEFLKNSGWNWTSEDTRPYVTNEAIIISEKEVEAYYNAATELYELYIKAAEWVIKHKRYDLLGIPENLIPLIEYTWENDENWHLYGRFDLSGGLDGKQIKLIEFNADTATCLPETAIIQWASLMANGYGEGQQFNFLFEALVATFNKIRTSNSSIFPSLLLSSMKGFPEDDTNISILQEAAKVAGFETEIEYIDQVDFSANEGVFKKINGDENFNQFNFWFKLIPWEFIAWDEPELLEILTELVISKKLIIFNPAYTLLFQSKAILKVLWDLYPNHPLLLETKDEPIYGKKSVKKVMFGREGSGISVISSYGNPVVENKGEYDTQKSIFQEYVEFIKDNENSFYQAGVFFSTEPCGLSFRKGGEIIDNSAFFVGHIVK